MGLERKIYVRKTRLGGRAKTDGWEGKTGGEDMYSRG